MRATIASAWVWFTSVFGQNSARSCLLYYDRASARLFLLDDYSSWTSGAPGTNATLQNSQCAVSLGASSVAVNGNTLTLNAAMTFASTYAGVKNIYEYAASASGANSGWQARGSWTTTTGSGVPTVTADSATPDAGATFTSWSGDCTTTSGNTCTVSMVAAKNVTANFTGTQYALTVTKAGTGGGTITSTPGTHS